ncbi:MAG: hypothetical protein ACRDPY_03390 [Streptosporangiaceae bacterium]
MDSTELRALQQPLKDAYREDPGQAVITLRAHGKIDDQAISCSVETGQALAVAGLHSPTPPSSPYPPPEQPGGRLRKVGVAENGGTSGLGGG